MYKLKYVFLIISVPGIFSCKKNFLDKAPGVDITENTVFSSKSNLDQFISTTYKYAVHSVFRYRDQDKFSTTVTVGGTDVVHPSSDISDEGKASEGNAGFPNTNIWNAGGVTSDNIVRIEDYRYYIRWIALRQIALILKRIDEVPDADGSYKNQVKGEMHVLRAMNYMEMIKRYGGVPIVDSVFNAGEQVNVPRASLADCFAFALKDCQDAIANNDLPAAFSPVLKGRANKATAYALKAKLLLFAASPQFNTGTPYLSMANAGDNKLICLGNYDAARWTAAATAMKEAIDYTQTNTYALIDVAANRKPAYPAPGTVGVAGNYRNSWEVYNNPEIIFGYQGNSTSNLTNAPITFFSPKCYGAFWSGITVPLNFFKKYEDTLGAPVTWSASGGSDLIVKYKSLDSRFRQTMNFTESYFNAANPVSAIFNGGKDDNGGLCYGGIWMRKYIPTNVALGGATFLNDVLFRVNELYISAAEALNESGATAEAYKYVDTLRVRSGMPRLPAGLSQSAFRDRVRNERAIELVFEDHRMWDIRRWLIAEDEGVMKGKFDGIRITRNGTGPSYTYSWLPYTFEIRTFNKNMYLHPFHLPEVLKGNLVQNPGW